MERTEDTTITVTVATTGATIEGTDNTIPTESDYIYNENDIKNNASSTSQVDNEDDECTDTDTDDDNSTLDDYNSEFGMDIEDLTEGVETLVKDEETGEYVIELTGTSFESGDENEEVKSNASYGNYKILNMEGKLIGLCDVKRFRWYLKKNLADQIDEKTLKINFEPNFSKGNRWQLVARDTMCVVCGSEDGLTKFHVVPLQFKRHYPLEKKEHNSTDVVLLCKACAVKANHVTDVFKHSVFKALGVSNNNFVNRKMVDIKKYAMKIRKNRNFSKDSEKELQSLSELVDCDDPSSITDEDIDRYCDVDCNCSYQGFDNIGEFTANAFIQKDKIDYFSYKWKENFVSNMEPEYLPKDFMHLYKEDQRIHNPEAYQQNYGSTGPTESTECIESDA